MFQFLSFKAENFHWIRKKFRDILVENETRGDSHDTDRETAKKFRSQIFAG